MMAPQESKDLAARLYRLEQSHRWWQFGTLLFAAVAVLALGTESQKQAAAQEPRTVAAQRFVLMSPGGRGAGAVMEFTSRGPELTFLDPGEKPRLRIGVDETGPGIHLLDARGAKRASVAFFSGEPAFVLYDTALRVRAVVSLVKDKPTITLLDENRRKVFEAP
ncbi:MAG TPA: hypothetical protein VI007_03360 [bacterium]